MDSYKEHKIFFNIQYTIIRPMVLGYPLCQDKKVCLLIDLKSIANLQKRIIWWNIS